MEIFINILIIVLYLAAMITLIVLIRYILRHSNWNALRADMLETRRNRLKDKALK